MRPWRGARFGSQTFACHALRAVAAGPQCHRRQTLSQTLLLRDKVLNASSMCFHNSVMSGDKCANQLVEATDGNNVNPGFLDCGCDVMAGLMGMQMLQPRREPRCNAHSGALSSTSTGCSSSSSRAQRPASACRGRDVQRHGGYAEEKGSSGRQLLPSPFWELAEMQWRWSVHGCVTYAWC